MDLRDTTPGRTALGPAPYTGGRSGAFALVLAPWVDAAAERMSQALSGVPDSAVDRGELVDGFADQLVDRLARWATPVLVHELHRHRDRGVLAGADAHERFTDFVRRYARPAALLTRHPVLGPELDRECATAIRVTAELCTRYAADQERITGTLLGGARSPVVATHPGGDRHQGGRATSVVELADGSRVVHKPRGVAAHLCLTALVALTNRLVPGLGLDTVDAVAGDGYGWTAYVRPAPLPSEDRAGAYYHRLGGLLALLHLVRATDMHRENLVASGDQPMLVDVETLFQPRLAADGPDPAATTLARSVARTGLLPAGAGRHGLTDISGAGGDAGQETASEVTEWADLATDRMRPVLRPGRLRDVANRPEWAGRPVEPADHADAVLGGFRQVYDAITRHRAEFGQALRACADVPVRVVVRPTRQYADLLAAVRAPELLRERDARRRVLLDACAGSSALVAGLAQHEAADLDVGDVPLFTARAGGHDLDATTGTLPGVLPTSGLADALSALASFGEFDRHEQEWVIAASLASRRVTAAGPRPVPAVVAAPAGADEALSAACAVADRVVTASVGADRVNWAGLEPVTDTRWLVLPMGAGLAHGYTGVALFLAQLGRVSGVARYAEVARHALDAVPDLLQALHGRPESVAAVGAGGLNGFGGIGYALARTATLLDDPEVAEWARAVVPLAAEAAELDPAPGWSDGLDGCAAALRALDAEIGCPAARELAGRCTGDTGEPAGPPRWCRHGVTSWTTADLSLCHGELGRADVSADDMSAAARHRATKAVLAALRRHGPRCVTPDEVPTPGLLTGLAGIGHGLLRLAFPDRVPSVLLLAPSPLPRSPAKFH